MQENLKNVFSKTNSLNQKLKELINNLQNEIKNNNNKKKEYSKKLIDINKEIKSEKDQKKFINEDMKNLENVITAKINKLSEYKKLKRGKNTVERSKKELFLYKSSEDLINIKQKQLKNVSKLNTILDKDISKINFGLKKGYYIDQEIQEEHPEIKTKSEELNFIFNKLSTDISIIKNEIQVLKNVKDSHNNCAKKISKLNKELEILKERTKMNICYSEIKAKNKEMNELKRKQIVANKAFDNTKFKFLMNQNNRYKNNRTISQNKNNNNQKIEGKLIKYNNKFFLTGEKGMNKNKKHNNESLLSEELNNITNNITNIQENNEDLSESKYKFLLQTKIEERNVQKRKSNQELKELNEEKNKKEAELKEKETKRGSVQKSNYDLQNLKKINEAKIKKYKKQLNELKNELKEYDTQIANKEQAFQELKDIVDSVINMQNLRV